jgi:hypothetical protein
MKQYLISTPYSKDTHESMTISHKCFDSTMITGLLLDKSNTDAYLLKHAPDKHAELKLFTISLLMPNTDSTRL